MPPNFWTNVFGQIHAIWQGIGVFVLGTIASYILATDPNAWNWKGVLVSAITGAATYILTRVDHQQSVKAAQSGPVTPQS